MMPGRLYSVQVVVPEGMTMIKRSVAAIPSPPRRGTVVFARWVAGHCSAGDKLLNIGAGKNLSGALNPIVNRDCFIVGIDPDDSIHDNESLHERYQQSMEDFAKDHEGEFDVAFSVYVLEHVSQPEAFMAACARVLRPGGKLFALTMNKYQYFGFITWGATRVGVSEWLLTKVKDRQRIEAYHFPTEYRLNSIPRLTRILDDAGFDSVEFRCFDAPRTYQSYLPSKARGVSTLYTKAVYAARLPWMMGHISFCAVRAATTPATAPPDGR